MFEWLPSQSPTQDMKKIAQMKKPIDIILKQLSENSCHYYILSAGTGAGKSSYFVNELYKSQSKSIICTQPKVALCKDKMFDLPRFTDLKPGVTLGYSVGNNQELKPSSNKNVVFMTTEKLQNKLLEAIQEDKMLDINYILIDEAHDISEQMIVTLLVVQQYVQHFPKCGVFIFMSATIDIDLFADYYNITIDKTNLGYITRQSGDASYKRIKKYFDKGSLEDRFTSALDYIYDLYKPNEQFRDTLIFCSDMQQIRVMMQYLDHHKPKYEYLSFSFTADDDQKENEKKQLFQKQTTTPKFIFSTSFLQAGITITTLKFMIDLGVYLNPCVFPLNNSQINIIRVPISDSNKEQRIGRVGRLGDGYALMLYPETYQFHKNDFNPFLVNSKQQYNILIKTFKMQGIIYNIPSLIYNPPILNYQHFKLLFPLSTDFLNKGIYILRNLNIIDSQSKLTPFGIYIITNQLDIIQTIALLCGAQFQDVCLISAIFNNRQVKQQTQDTLMKVFYEKKFNLLEKIQPALLANVFNDVCDLQQEFNRSLKFDQYSKFDYQKFMDIVKQCELQ